MTYRTKPSLLVVAAIALAAVTCDGGSGTRSNEAPTKAGPTGSPEHSLVSDLLALPTDGGQNLFEVDADHAEYWRMFTLDRYDGELWTSTNPDGSVGGLTLSAPAMLPRDGGDPPPGEPLTQTFRILSDIEVEHALPMAQTAQRITGSIGDITWDPARSQAFIDGHLEAGMEYTVRSRIVVPTPEELDRVDHQAP